MPEKMRKSQAINLRELGMYAIAAISSAIIIGETQAYPEKPYDASSMQIMSDYDIEYSQFVLNMIGVGCVTVGSMISGGTMTYARTKIRH